MKANTLLNLGFSSMLAAVLWLGAGPHYLAAPWRRSTAATTPVPRP